MSNNRLDLDYFEKIVVCKSLTDERYLASIIDYIQPRFFSDKHIGSTFNIIKSFFTKRSTIPTNTEILTLCTTPELKSSFKHTLQIVKDLDRNLNKDELYSNTERFLKEKSVYYTMMDVASDCSSGNINTSEILNKFERCSGINLTASIGFDMLTDYSELITDLETVQPTISTGWDWFDKKLDGGFLANGRSLYIFAGETNVGKSIVLGNIACNIAKQGKTVLLVSLEMSEMVYAKRLAGNLTGIEINSLKYEIPQLKTKLDGFISQNPASRLLIKEFPPSTLTPSQLGSFIKRINEAGITLDAIVIDYLNLLDTNIGNNSYERVGNITKHVRALSYIHACPVISATQLNRTAYGQEIPEIDTLSESMGIGHHADAVFSVFQTEEDKELDIIRFGVMKNRYGNKNGVAELGVHYPTLTLTQESNENIDDMSSNILSSMEDIGS